MLKPRAEVSDYKTMDQTETRVGSQAERLTQLADLHRQGVLNDEEYERSVSRLVQGDVSSPPSEPSADSPTRNDDGSSSDSTEPGVHQSLDETQGGSDALLPSPPDGPMQEQSPTPTSQRASAAKVVALAVAGIVALAVIATLTGGGDDDTKAPTANGDTAAAPVESSVAPVGMSTPEDAASYIWAQRQESICIIQTQGLSQGQTYDSLEATFLAGYNGPLGVGTNSYPGVDGSAVFAILWGRCVDLGY